MSKIKAMSKAAEGVASIPEMSDEMQKHETNGHMNTLLDAFDIMNDKDKMAKVHKMVGRKKKAISSLSELRDIANKKKPENEEGELS